MDIVDELEWLELELNEYDGPATRAKSEITSLRQQVSELQNKLREATEWRPIESAPRDYTQILVYCSHGQYVASWEVDCDWWGVDENKHGPFPLRGEEPSHWLPLPAAPSVSPKPESETK